MLPETDEETRTVNLHKVSAPFIDVTRFSKWGRLVRATAYVRRPFLRKRRSELKYDTVLTSEELMLAENDLYQLAQDAEFGDIKGLIKGDEPLPRRNFLRPYAPFIDDNGVMRADGRIDAAPIPYDMRRPIILPAGHHVTMFIIRDCHERLLHQHHETVINELRRKYYVPRLRNEVKKYCHKCTTCIMRLARPEVPRMAALPYPRVTPYTRPFCFIGVDYAGPLQVVCGRRIVKRWIMLITCLTTRAIHIEIVHSMSTSSCIMGLRCFTSLRGTPREIYSDRGTNFIGCERQLREELASLNRTKLLEAFVTPQTRWLFNPPAAPHTGGLWERMIRTVKNVLYSSLPKHLPDD